MRFPAMTDGQKNIFVDIAMAIEQGAWSIHEACRRLANKDYQVATVTTTITRLERAMGLKHSSVDDWLIYRPKANDQSTSKRARVTAHGVALLRHLNAAPEKALLRVATQAMFSTFLLPQMLTAVIDASPAKRLDVQVRDIADITSGLQMLRLGEIDLVLDSPHSLQQVHGTTTVEFEPVFSLEWLVVAPRTLVRSPTNIKAPLDGGISGVTARQLENVAVCYSMAPSDAGLFEPSTLPRVALPSLDSVRRYVLESAENKTGGEADGRLPPFVGLTLDWWPLLEGIPFEKFALLPLARGANRSKDRRLSNLARACTLMYAYRSGDGIWGDALRFVDGVQRAVGNAARVDWHNTHWMPRAVPDGTA